MPCQYCNQRATYKHTPSGATYVMHLCENHYWKCVDFDAELMDEED
jgi:hypothetical protein